MTTLLPSFDQLSDSDLLREVTRLAAREREATVRLVASLAVLDRRRLYLAEGYGSLFVYCTEVLRLSESATYKRITAARAAQRFPVILERLAAGDVTLTTVRLLAPHLTDANHVALLDEVRHRSTREVEQVVARLQPRADVPSAVRKLPAPPATTPVDAAADERCSSGPAEPQRASASTDDEAPPLRPATDTGSTEAHSEPERRLPLGEPRRTVTPLAPTRYKVSFTISAETYAKLREAEDLLRHVLPDGDVAALFDRGLTLLLREAAKTKRAATDQPRAGSAASGTPKAGSRHIPAEVKRRVWARDGGQCAFMSASGRRCTERGLLEYHHCMPYAVGGEASVENISLRCKRHNAHEAEQAFGPWRGTAVRERRPHYGVDVLAASDAPPCGMGRAVFAALGKDRECSPDQRAPLHASPPPSAGVVQLAARPVRGSRSGERTFGAPSASGVRDAGYCGSAATCGTVGFYRFTIKRAFSLAAQCPGGLDP